MLYRASRFRRRAIFIIAILFVTVSVVAHQWYFREPPLNLVLITLDTTRADRLGVYGYQDGLKTDFDRFAANGIVFERAFAPAPITLPSHATMLTGLYPPEHGLRVNGQGRLAQEIPLLPETLKKRGYETAGFIAAAVLDATYGLNRGFDVYDDFASQQRSERTRRHRRLGQDVVDNALSWLGDRTSRPFFCWIHLFDAHNPYDAREGMFGEQFKQNPYDAGIAVEIQQVERVFAFLKEHHLDQNTLVVIAGDHGEGLGDHGETEHGMCVYNATLHVPLIFVGTRHCRPGRRVSTPVSLVDITPTVLDVLGISSPNHVSGRSLRSALEGKEIATRHYYAEAESPYVFNHWSPLYAIISDRWKYIHSTRSELYDLVDDFSEQKNLIDTSTEERKELENVLELMQRSFKSVSPQKLQLSDRQLGDLNALGYVGPPKNLNDSQGNSEVLLDIKDMLPALEKFDRAKELALENKTDEAIVMLREISQRHPDGEFLEASFLLVDCLAMANRLEEAADICRGLLDKRPKTVQIGFRLGTILASQGKFEEAEVEFRKFLKQEPESAPAHFELGKVLVKLQRVKEGIAEYRETLRITPKFAPAQFQLGQLFVRLNRPKEAASCFEDVIRIEPGNAIAQTTLLGLFVQLDEYGKAFEVAKNAVKTDPNSFEAHFNLGILLTSQKRYREAISEFREAQKLVPDDPRPVQQIRQAEEALERGRR